MPPPKIIQSAVVNMLGEPSAIKPKDWWDMIEF
jgi:hypothetical protein